MRNNASPEVISSKEYFKSGDSFSRSILEMRAREGISNLIEVIKEYVAPERNLKSSKTNNLTEKGIK